MHLAIDGYTGNHSLLQDQEHVRQFLDSFPDRIGMTKIITPQSFDLQRSRAGGLGCVRLRHHRREPH